MNILDWGIIGLYIVGIVATGAYLSRTQTDISDYFLGGRRVSWWESGLSTMSSQLGAISFISAPAFVALKENGGLKWLAYEFSVPIALILVMAVIVPTLHRANVISIYEYLEKRFDRDTRSLVSVLFQIGRGLATAVSVLIGGLILSTALGIPTAAAILTMGVATIVYDALGGIRVVIVSDVVQMVIIMLGLVVSTVAALNVVGWDAAWSSLSAERLEILDFRKQTTYSFWPMVFGGFILYASYYGCDQSQVQRELSVSGMDNVKKSLLLNAFGRFPLVLLYCALGVFVGAVVTTTEFPTVAANVLHRNPDAIASALDRDPDRMVPLFILTYIPHGLIGLFFVAILSALMSNLDSALNSMSAVTVRDFYQRYWKPNESRDHYLFVSKVFTAFWGVFCLSFALLFAGTPEATRQTTIVLINAIGSILYGPILAAFLLGMLTRRAGPSGIKSGIIVGIVSNVLVWLLTPISWLWWNVTGLFATIVTTLIVSSYETMRARQVSLEPEQPSRLNWKVIYGVVGLYFIAIVGICRLIEIGV